MEAVKQAQKKIIQRALWLSIIAGLAFIVIGHKPVGKGLVLGTIFSVLNFILMAKSIGLKFGRSKKQAISISLGSIIVRYILLAVPLIAAIKFEQFNFIAAVVGIFIIQLVILADHMRTLIPYSGGKQV
ncbi:MAG: ATP synthase subunit I [Desulfobacterales bacterium]|nr:ATP synthase subunit I [Desulfobacterales bacterium]